MQSDKHPVYQARTEVNEVGEHCRLGRVWADLSRKFYTVSGNDERVGPPPDDGKPELMGTITRVMAYNELLQLCLHL